MVNKLRVNYRLSGDLAGDDTLASTVVKIRTSLQLQTGVDNRTQSIPLGFTPSWVFVNALAGGLQREAYVFSTSFNNTILYVSYHIYSLGATCSLNDIDLTYTQVFEVFALVASR